LEISSQIHESVDASYSDGNDSEQSWMVRSLSESSVACVTSDFAMQNVLLQMGLRLLAPGGNQIRQLHRYAIVVHVCIGFPIIFYFLDWIIVVIFLSLKTSALAGGY
jgi:RNA-binding protein NOB1